MPRPSWWSGAQAAQVVPCPGHLLSVPQDASAEPFSSMAGVPTERGVVPLLLLRVLELPPALGAVRPSRSHLVTASCSPCFASVNGSEASSPMAGGVGACGSPHSKKRSSKPKSAALKSPSNPYAPSRPGGGTTISMSDARPMSCISCIANIAAVSMSMSVGMPISGISGIVNIACGTKIPASGLRLVRPVEPEQPARRRETCPQACCPFSRAPTPAGSESGTNSAALGLRLEVGSNGSDATATSSSHDGAASSGAMAAAALPSWGSDSGSSASNSQRSLCTP
mmetsp:Transcript_141542/g.394440  ORF Transcript_141542/g.394440 Transcript_141542/m.394440 type:complete len:283 (-) Transcript_141542:800-1648(-)